MASHVKKKPLPVKAIIISICSVLAVGLVVGGILLVNNGFLDTIAGLMDISKEAASSAISDKPSSEGKNPSSGGNSSVPDSSDQSSTPVEIIKGSGNYTRPEQMRGIWLTPGEDYLLSARNTGADVKKQIDSAFASMAVWEFNTILLPMMYGDKALYASDLFERVELKEADGSAFDPLAYILQQAKEKNMYVYGIIDCRIGEEDGWDPTIVDEREKIVKNAAQAAAAYAFDGFLLEDYSYALGETGSHEAFEEQSSGDFDAFVTGSIRDAILNGVQEIRKVNRDLYVGLLSNAVWAHKRVDARGSETNGIYEDLTDGHADTLEWLESGIFDFVLVRDYSSTSHSTANFNNILTWWSSLCQRLDMPMYIAHASDRVGSDNAGWKAYDQLAKQYLFCQEVSNWKGSAFSSLAALKKNLGKSTDLLVKAFKGDFLSDYVSDKLTITNPKSPSFTTNESKLSFAGSCNPNFPLTVNGNPVELSKHGYFNLDYELKIGLNTFKFEHNGQTMEYKVNYVVNILQSVAPKETLKMEGGSAISISAIARKDASVYAMINGVKVAMKPVPLQSDENGAGEIPSDFENYSGEYTLPDGIIGKVQNLGNIEIFVSYQGLSKNMKGGAIVVNALPEPPPPPPPESSEPPSSEPGSSSTSSGGETPQPGNVLVSGREVVITAPYVQTFSGNTVDDYSRPVNAYLPKGTSDVLVKEVYDSASRNSYYLLGSGRRIYKTGAALGDQKDFTANELQVAKAQVNAGNTAITLDASWKIPYNVSLLPQYYVDPNGNPQNYHIGHSRPIDCPVCDRVYGHRQTLDEDAQETEYVDITFYYTTQVGDAPDVSGSPLIKQAEWIKGEDNTYILRLYLTRKGGFYGYSVNWDSDGNLSFTFKHPAATAANSSEKRLNGVKIVLDPGHGGNSGTEMHFNTNEKTLTLIYAKLLQSKLEDLGATVVMARTTAGENPTLEERANLGRNNGTDLFLSIHMNGGGGKGSSFHYFNEYSYMVSQLMWEKVRAVEDSYELGCRYQAVAFSPFYVTRLHDTAAVLIECGFYDNKDNAELLIDPVYQEKFTQGLVDGILDYFSRLPGGTDSVTSTTSTGEGVTQPEETAISSQTAWRWFLPFWNKER